MWVVHERMLPRVQVHVEPHFFLVLVHVDDVDSEHVGVGSWVGEWGAPHEETVCIHIPEFIDYLR